MKMYHETNKVVQTQFFDADAIAMRMEKTSIPKPLYQDREGKIYAFNDSEGYYEKASILPSSLWVL